MKRTILILAVIIILIVLGVVFTGERDNQSTRDNTIKIGYIIYPPLLEKDPKSGELSGVSYDIVEAVAKELSLVTDWSEEVGWGTALEGLKTNRYDVLGTQMWPNEARERAATFSISPMNSEIYAWIKNGDTRFTSFQDINSSEYKIITVDGDIAVSIAQEDFPKADLLTLPQLASISEIFLNVIQNKADVTFTEQASAEDFLKSQPNSIQKLGDDAIRSFGNSFAFNKENKEFIKDWNNALEKLIKNGEIEKILTKNNVLQYYQLD